MKLMILISFCILFSCAVLCEEYISKYEQMLELYPKPTYEQTKSYRSSSNKLSNEHPCKRTCHQNDAMICYYYFIAHYDETFNPSCKRYLDKKFIFKFGGRKYIDIYGGVDDNSTAVDVYNDNEFDDCIYIDGVKMQVMVINGQLPGQAIEVCLGDTVVVDVINSMHDITTIHWHGLHQRHTPYMDGAPYITQYPIQSGEAYRYRFKCMQFGTYWWHSHVGHQRGFGLAGALVVRQPISENKHRALYDFDYSEHTILIQDLIYHINDSLPQNILIDGMGRRSLLNVDNNDGNELKNNTLPTLYSTYTVVRNGRYRFRVIFNGITNCPISFSIDNHELVIIASDGNDIEPITVSKITFHGGERYDFILHANQEIQNYWIRVKGYNFCAQNQLHQEAILHYYSFSRHTLPDGDLYYAYEPKGREFNTVDKPPTKDKEHLITVADLKSLKKSSNNDIIPYRTYYVSMNIHVDKLLFQMDNITFSFPSHISLLQSRNLDISQFQCNKTQLTDMGINCSNVSCECTNVIEVPASKDVEFVISSTSETSHPIHLHGYTFQVVAMGVLGEDRIEDIEQIDRCTPLPRRVRDAPLKDTVQVPAFGYTIIRFRANNPGYWFIHCHISIHAENGMAAVLRVGTPMEMNSCLESNCGLCNSIF